MDKFARWSSVAHATLRKFQPLKLGQVHQLLAAGFGHSTYASFRQADLQRLNCGVEYVCFNDSAALARALELGMPFTEEQWRELGFALRPSGVTGNTWLTDLNGMAAAARLTFEASGDSRIEAIYRSIGSAYGLRAKTSRRLGDADGLPAFLVFEILGDVQAFGDDVCLSVPVACQVAFPRVGRRIYAEGEVQTVDRCGEPEEFEPEFEGEFYGMSEE